MKIGVFSFTEKGGQLGDMIKGLAAYDIVHHRNKDIGDGVKSIVGESMEIYDALVFIGATGIAVRFIAPYLKHKSQDPAIISIDDLGRFTISLLSGHIGGGNELTLELAKHIESVPVISTASDIRGFQALDLFAKKHNYHMEDKKDLTKIMAMMVNDKKIGFYSEDKMVIDYPHLKIIEDLNNIDNKDLQALIIISCKNIKISTEIPYIILRPKNINIGIGCKRDIPGDRIIGAIDQSLDLLNLSNKSIKAMGTVEIKKDEQGIIDAAKHFSCPLKIYSIEEIRKVEDQFQGSQFVKDTIGVASVSEPCAYLLGGEILLGKSKHNGITISISKE